MKISTQKTPLPATSRNSTFRKPKPNHSWKKKNHGNPRRKKPHPPWPLGFASRSRPGSKLHKCCDCHPFFDSGTCHTHTIHVWLIFMVHVGKYTIHGCYGISFHLEYYFQSFVSFQWIDESVCSYFTLVNNCIIFSLETLTVPLRLSWFAKLFQTFQESQRANSQAPWPRSVSRQLGFRSPGGGCFGDWKYGWILGGVLCQERCSKKQELSRSPKIDTI